MSNRGFFRKIILTISSLVNIGNIYLLDDDDDDDDYYYYHLLLLLIIKIQYGIVTCRILLCCTILCCVV